MVLPGFSCGGPGIETANLDLAELRVRGAVERLAILASGRSLGLLTALLFTATALSGLAISATGAVMSTVRPEIRGQAGGWAQAGNIGAGMLGGGAGVWMASFCGLPVLAVAAVSAMFLPALAALWIVEKPHPPLPARRLFGDLGRDIGHLLCSWRTCMGLLFFLSPVGAGAVAGLISSVAPDYHAPTSEIAWVTGAGGGLLLAAGGLIGGFPGSTELAISAAERGG
jgi:MFS transporter, PAT family, beta-lactamase induction signal transducer AmpG